MVWTHLVSMSCVLKVRCDTHCSIALLFFVMCGRTRCTEVVGRDEGTRAELARIQEAKNAADQEVNHRSNNINPKSAAPW